MGLVEMVIWLHVGSGLLCCCLISVRQELCLGIRILTSLVLIFQNNFYVCVVFKDVFTLRFSDNSTIADERQWTNRYWHVTAHIDGFGQESSRLVCGDHQVTWMYSHY